MHLFHLTMHSIKHASETTKTTKKACKRVLPTEWHHFIMPNSLINITRITAMMYSGFRQRWKITSAKWAVEIMHMIPVSEMKKSHPKSTNKLKSYPAKNGSSKKSEKNDLPNMLNNTLNNYCPSSHQKLRSKDFK